MGLREDVKYRLGEDYEPKVPESMSLDIQAIKTLAEEEER